MVDVVQGIKAFNDGRDPERLAMKYKNMRSSPFVFLRGTCHLFYERLPKSKLFEKSPLTWVCGDLHLENFGSFKGDNRQVYFDLNDFDEASLAPCTWELVRLLSSILIGAESLGVNPSEALCLCNEFLDAYAACLADGKARWVERETAEGMVKQLLDGLQQRPRKQYLDSRTDSDGKKRHFRIDGKHALAVTAEQHKKVTSFMKEFAAQQDNPRFYKVLDVARRIAGNGSLGVERYAVLVQGKGSPDSNFVLDIKQALPSSLKPFLKVKQPKWESEAHRVVTVQRRMQAISMAFLQPVIIEGTPFILRGLQPTEDRVALDQWDKKLRRLEGVVRTMGHLTAWAQLRSSGRGGSAIADELIDFARKQKWKSQLIEAARHCSDQVNQDWHEFVQAYDDGVYKL